MESGLQYNELFQDKYIFESVGRRSYYEEMYPALVQNRNRKPTRFIKYIFLMVSLSSIMGVIGVSPFGKYIFIFGMITSNIFIYLVHRKNLKETIYTYFISTVIILIIQYLALAILLVLKFERSLDFEGGLLAQSIILPIILLIYKLVP